MAATVSTLWILPSGIYSPVISGSTRGITTRATFFPSSSTLTTSNIFSLSWPSRLRWFLKVDPEGISNYMDPSSLTSKKEQKLEVAISGSKENSWKLEDSPTAPVTTLFRKRSGRIRKHASWYRWRECRLELWTSHYWGWRRRTPLDQIEICQGGLCCCSGATSAWCWSTSFERLRDRKFWDWRSYYRLKERRK